MSVSTDWRRSTLSAARAPLLPRPPIEPDDTTPDFSYSLARWLEDAAALHTDVLVLAVALTLTLAADRP
ncbi:MULTISPECIES: hypothetical protein [unclassified Streptomyces]|uniref:hypothetical protein n=1 Tax=unclassified Streptomyces TaxID=2593676 RepID=UPI0022531110|nr:MULTISPECIES: hypothetical protein [unclassified Streptomyces]MCX4407790.1 hypothetical protein [Streptomyces sp. NBC_01764]MCX5187487.1 hypothetical protein [Streptomyces sp. NBC_00268]